MGSKKKKEKDPNALPLRRVISNNLYALGLIHSVAPSYLPTYFLWSVGNGIFSFLVDTWLLREIINRYEMGRGVLELLGLLVGLLAANFVWNLFTSALPQIVYPRYRQKITEKIESELFRRAAEVELACYETPKFYDKYVKAMDNAYGRVMDVVYTADNFIWNMTSVLTKSALIFFIDPVLMVFALIPLLSGLIQSRRDRVKKTQTDEWRSLDRFESYIQRTFYLNEYAKEMRLSDMPRLLYKKYEKNLGDYVALFKKYGLRLTVLQFLTNINSDFTAFAAMMYAAFRTLVTHTMLIGDCLVIFRTVNSVAYQLMRVTGVLADFRNHAMYLEDYRFFVDYEPKIDRHCAGLSAGAGTLAVNDLTFTYTGAESPTLRNISFSIKPGEKIALVGQNGSGKTTLVKLLLHLYDPDSGSVTLDGRDIGEYSGDSYRGAFTTVFQDFKIFSMSVAENVLLRPLRDGDDELVAEALKKSGAYEKVMSLPNGINTTLTREFDDEGAVLSGGEAQKVTLARAFTNSSPFVILDEPSSALDPIAEYNMFENMMEACRDRTLIFISHRLSSAVLADRIILLDGGQIAECGTHEELMAKDGMYAKMFRMQAENYKKTDSESEVRTA